MLLRFLVLTVVLLSQAEAVQMPEITAQGIMRRFLMKNQPRSQALHAARWCSSFAQPFQGRFVHVDMKGITHICQPRYPQFQELKKTGSQLFSAIDGIWFNEKVGKYYRAVGPMKISTGPNPMPWRDIEEVDIQQGFFAPNPVITEATLTSIPYEIVNPEQVDRSPYFSCGRVDMIFPQTDVFRGGTYHGSAAAIDQNLLITAAHNFMPSVLEDKENKNKVKAQNIRFLHLHTTRGSRGAYIAPIASTHCFIHPKWEESFDPHYDVGFMFLAESISMTQAKKEELLKLHILPHTLEDSVQIVGYPRGSNNMQKTRGISQKYDSQDLMKVIYHTANTESGNSGSPIVMGRRSLVGVHTRAPEWGGEHNRGVRMRHDIISFLDDCISQHQRYLEDSDKFLVEQEAKKKAAIAEQEEKLKQVGIAQGVAQGIAQGVAQGKAEGVAQGKAEVAAEVALALMSLLGDQAIANATKLPLSDVQALRASLGKS